MNFKQYRLDRNLTQAQAGALIGMSGPFWAQLESGQLSDAKTQAFACTLPHLAHADIDRPLTAERMHSVKQYGLNFSQASEQIGASANVWSNLLNGHLEHKTRWVRLVNALLIDLAEKKADLDLTPGGEIEVLMPQVLTPADESPMVEEEISDQPGLIPFAYGSQKVRVKWINEEPWFMLSDVCRAIGYKSIQHAISLIRERDIQKVEVIDSMGRAQLANFVSERGMSQFFLRARVPAVEPFQDWVFDEVLPSIRKTGQYQAQPQLELNNPLSHLAAIGQAFQTIAEQMQIQEQKIANLEQAAQQVKYLEIAKTDRSEVLEILHSELVEQKAKDRIEQLNHYRQRKELEKRVSDVAWLAVKAHGGDHGDIIKETNKRIKMAIRGAHGYAIGRERYQDQDFILAYQVVAMIEKEIGDFPRQGEIDFGKDK